jgi:pimeloyl-ACP methyl ester carboxylesterase
MRGSEIRAAGELAGAAVAGTGTLIKDMHEAVAGRTFRALGPLGAPTRVVHDGVTRAVHAGVRTSLGALPRGGAAMLALSAPPGAPALAESVRGSLALGALNGAIGDALQRTSSDLALSMTVRRRGRDVAPEPAAIAVAFPDASPRLAVFVHGLCETDEAWRLLPLTRERAARPSYGQRLQRELGYTPVHVRYNTGLHISDNGRALARLLEDLVAAWPHPVSEIVLVGHSMGGLVSRSACHYGHADGHAWVESLRHVFCLGTPHLGAPLEKAANVFGWSLSRLPETRAFAKVVNGRSVGIKDLRFGSCAEEDWCECEPDEFLRDRCREVPFLETATYYFVGATLTGGPVGNALGDLLVRYGSASGAGRKRRIGFEVDNGLRLQGLTHFDLLNHPAVYAQIRSWIERGRPAELPEVVERF